MKKRQNYLFIFSLISLIFINGCSGLKEKSMDEKNSELYFGYGTEELLKKNYTTALNHLHKAVELDPKNSKIHNNIGMAYFFKGDTKIAIEHIQKSIELDKDNDDAKNNLASIYYQTGKLDDAEKIYKEIEKNLLYPNQYRTLYNLGLIAQKKQNDELAISYFQKALKENPDHCPAYFKLGQHFLETDQYQKAYDHFLDGSKGNCYKEPAPQYYLGLTLEKLDKLQDAKNKFNEVIERFPKTIYAQMSKKQIDNLEVSLSKINHEMLSNPEQVLEQIEIDKKETLESKYQSPTL